MIVRGEGGGGGGGGVPGGDERPLLCPRFVHLHALAFFRTEKKEKHEFPCHRLFVVIVIVIVIVCVRFYLHSEVRNVLAFLLWAFCDENFARLRIPVAYNDEFFFHK